MKKRVLSFALAALMLVSSNSIAYAAESTEAAPVEGTVTTDSTDTTSTTTETQSAEGTVTVESEGDSVTITDEDKPILALGADLTDDQRNTVLSLMGLDPANLSNYTVVYVTNDDEHKYLDSYMDSSEIGSKSWSSVVIVPKEDGNGLNIETKNISYCTVDMYKNALTTAGITDADIIVCGPQSISGTAALVGIFKAYEESTGDTIDDSVIDAAMNELVITGELNGAIDGLSDAEVADFIAYIKALIAENGADDEDSINKCIDQACEKYGVTLSDDDRQKIIDLVEKINALGLDLSSVIDFASGLLGNGSSNGVMGAVGQFFTNIGTAIGNFFKNLFS